MEDELRDPRTFVEYFLPRPLRLALFGGGAASCFIAVLLAVSKLLEGPAALVLADGTASNLGVNLCGLVVFLALFSYDLRAAERRKERRKMVRDAQIKFGDREVFYTAEGQKMSILKEVNADWIIRRLDRWGKRDGMPFLGPEKGALLEQLVQERQPQLVVEVGTLCGYSAIRAGRVLPEGGRVVTMEKDFLWMLAAKRFIWQAQLSDKVDVQWGDAKQLLQKLPQSQKIDLLFLDGLPKETLEYLKAAEPMLAPGAMVVADNAGVFAEGGLKPYLQYVRNSPQYQSRLLETPLQWRDDVQDGMEVSTFCAP